MWKILLLVCASIYLSAANQTSYVTLPLSEDSLPYRLSIQQANFSLPAGLQTFVQAEYKGEWLLLGGRTYGLHGFSGDTFPVRSQNTDVYVLNLETGQTISRSLYDPTAHLSQEQIEQLSTSNALFFQPNGSKTLYMVGGYGINSKIGVDETKSVLTAIDIPNLIKWVKQSPKCKSAAKCLRQISHPLLQVTGGIMLQSNAHQPYLLGFGQNFVGNYIDTTSNGIYTHQIRPFQIIDTGKDLFVQPYSQPLPNPLYRRRDLNIVPIIKKTGPSYTEAFVALGGVFTPADSEGNFGAWTIPIEINPDGSSFSTNPDTHPGTFAQGMNNYACATTQLYSQKTNDMYIVLFGGISLLYSVPGATFAEDPNLPFVNDVTTIQIDSSGNFEQYFMSATFPSLPPFWSVPPPSPSELFFGSLAAFFPAKNLPQYANGVINFDRLGKSPLLLGYIVGGIASSQQETESEEGNVDTHASPYVFTVTLEPL